MDTLSRKHRLRQQQQLLLQQLARNKEIKSDGNNNNNNKENLPEPQQWQDWRLECNLACARPASRANNGARNPDEDEQDFKVFKVSRHLLASAKHTGKLFTDSSKARSQLDMKHYENLRAQEELNLFSIRSSSNKCQTPTSSLDDELGALDELASGLERPQQHLDDEQDCQLERRQHQRQESSFTRQLRDDDEAVQGLPVVGANHRGSLNTSDCSTSSSRSTVNSSGFVSMPRLLQTNKQADKLLKQKSNMVDHLNLKLASEIDSSLAAESERAPSRASMYAIETTLTRAGEHCYSTLCREDFSSFIPTGQAAPEVRRHASHLSPADRDPNGPSLVGLHDEPPEYQEVFSQDYDVEQDEDDDDRDDDSECSAHQSTTGQPEEASALSNMLDVHMARMNSLLRLMAGDSRISLEDAFDDHHLPISEENRTLVDYLPAQSRRSVTVIQETQSIDLRPEDELLLLSRAEIEAKCSVYSRVISSDFGALAAGEQIEPELDFSVPTLDTKLNKIDREQLVRRMLDQFSSLGLASRKLEAKVNNYVGDFLKTYERYHECLRAQTSFASDWHENWLFAHKRAGDERNENESSRSKRARISQTSHLDLLTYSTLLLSKPKPKPMRLSYLLDESVQAKQRQTISQVEAIYASQEPLEEELSWSAASSRDAIDLCSLLINGSFADGDELDHRSSQVAVRQKKALKVSYLTSYMLCKINLERFHFCAYGYLFESPLVAKGGKLRHRQLRQAILTRLRAQLETTNGRPKCHSSNALDQDKAHFTINLSGSVELVNRIPVIQFCAKIAGCLPINVRWFRGETEIGRAQEEARGKLDWPLGMRAVYSLVEPTEWASRYTFRRDHSAILFEIQDASAEFDYNQTYRCVLENVHNRCESTFTLSLGQLRPRPRTSRPARLARQASGRSRALFLRTWSQRTLHRPVPSTSEPVKPGACEPETQLTPPVRSKTQTVGRLSESGADDTLGKDFPYHPENLLRRLQENKFSSATLLKRHKLTPHSQQDDSSGYLELDRQLDKAQQVSH